MVRDMRDGIPLCGKHHQGSQMDSEKCEMTDDLIRETDRFWEDPQKIMHLIDLLFLWEDPDKKQVCS